MSLFGPKTPASILGVDLSSSSIKIVELSNKNGEGKLLTYGYVEFPFTDTDRAALEDLKNTATKEKKMEN